MQKLFLLALAGLALATDPVFFEFTQFVAKYGKYYQTQEEFEYRLEAFKNNLKRIDELNEKNVKAGGKPVHGVNIFADIPRHEFAQRLMKNLTNPLPGTEIAPKPAVPLTDVDWRTKNAVTAVKDQGQCGSCWAFSATEATESFYYLVNTATHKLYDLSAQQVTACTYVNYNGCNGGWPKDGYTNGIIARQGEDSDASYPYNIAQAGNCKFGNTGKADAPEAWLTTYKSYAQGQLQNILNTVGPPSVCVAAEDWQTYTSGILKTCTGEVDHCVQAVGYTQSGSEPYWLVRNSWGASWGEKGYIYLDMTVNNGDICHIQEYMTVPTAQN